MKKKALLICLAIFIYISFRGFSLSQDLYSTYIKPLLPFTNYLLGSDNPTSYLILLGNDTEARANGGFAGSYAKVVLSSSPVTPDLIGNPYKLVPIFIDSRSSGSDKLNMKTTFSFHDIYVPNGQLLGSYVKPPDPVQQAFGHGTWELANADFEPNFPTAATSIRWFLEKGKETNPDILGIINLSTIKKIINIIGPFPLEDSKTIITPENLYLYLQGKAELNFFPGSTQKADALHTVGTAAIKKAKSLSILKKYQIAKIIITELNNQNLVLNSINKDFQELLKSKKWAGEYLPPKTSDFYGLVEMNLGANKANAYVTRQSTHTISAPPSSSLREGTPTRQSIQIIHKVNIQLQNTSPEANPNPPLHYGGNYIAYMRLFIPQNATNIEINHTEIATDSAGFSPDVLNNQSPPVIASGSAAIQSSNFTTIGFWHITLAGNSSQINLSYTLPIENEKDYSLTILKQNGFPSSPQTLNIFSKSLTTDLTYLFTFP